jgi:hypothetical protein
MAGEIQATYASGRTLYALIRNSVGQIWNGSGWEAYTTSHLSTYVQSMTEQGSASGYYVGTFPSTIAAGIYAIVVKQQLGGSAAETDPVAASGDLQWNGTYPLPLSDVATSGQVGQIAPLRMAKGVAISGFVFPLVSSADNKTAFTSGVVSGQISRNAGAFGALQSGNVSEVGLGFYSCPLTSGDLNADMVALLFTANGISGGTSNPARFTFVMQRVSGSL